MRNRMGGSSGITVIIGATILSCLAITVLSGTWYQWVFCGLGILVGLRAVKIIDRMVV